MENEATPRLIVPDPEMPDAETVRKWLNICAYDSAAKHCREFPYYRESGSSEDGCGKLLLDAARIIKFLLG